MRLFKLTKELPVNWFNDTHQAITESETIGQLDLLKSAIEDNLSSFYISNRDKAGLMMLLAYCNLRYQLLKNQSKRQFTYKIKY